MTVQYFLDIKETFPEHRLDHSPAYTKTPTQKSLSHCTMFISYCASNKVEIHFLVPVTALKINQCPITGIN